MRSTPAISELRPQPKRRQLPKLPANRLSILPLPNQTSEEQLRHEPLLSVSPFLPMTSTNSAQDSLVSQIADDVRRELDSRHRPRGSTYRFQFNKQFTFK